MQQKCWSFKSKVKHSWKINWMHCCYSFSLPFNLRHVYSLLHHFSELCKNKCSRFFFLLSLLVLCFTSCSFCLHGFPPTTLLFKLMASKTSSTLWLNCVRTGVILHIFLKVLGVMGDVHGSTWEVILISWVVGKHLLSVTHLGNFVCGDSKPQIPRLFLSRSLLGTGAAFAELKDKFIQ